MTGNLMLGSKSIQEWRAASQTSHRARFAHLLEQADSYLAYLPPAEHPRETITYIGMAVANLALAFRLTGNERYLDCARKWIQVAVNYPHWGRAHLPDHDLDAGWLLFGLSLGYDWLYQDLPGSERDALDAKLMVQGTRLYEYAVDTAGEWWSSAYWQNHNWICYAGLLAVAYALERAHSETRAWSNRAVENFRTVLSLLPEDGSDYEGVIYWCYGVPWLLIAADLIQQQTDLDLYQSEFLRNTFYYRLYTSAPNLVDTANLGDCHDRRSAHAAAIYYRLASVHRNGYAQGLADHFEQMGEWERERRQGMLRPGMAPQAFLEFLWYDPTVAPVSIADLPLAHAFPDLGLVSARTDWSTEGTFIAFKCGKPNGEKAWTLGHAMERRGDWKALKPGHAHPDENGFIIVCGGDYVAVDEGYSQAKQSRHHNTVLVDGKGQYREGGYSVFEGLGAEWGGRLEDHFAGRRTVYARGQAAGAYDPALGLERFTRQTLFVDGKGVVICDDLAACTPREFTWLLQTDEPLSETSPNQFENRVGETSLRVSVVEPATCNAKKIAQEIVAFPSASTPEWVLRHTQHTLMLETQRTTETRFLVALGLACATEPPVRAEVLRCDAGGGLELRRKGRTILAFARDQHGIKIPEALDAVARWIVAGFNGETLLYLAAGDATSVRTGEQLRFASTEPVTFEMDTGKWRLQTRAPVWASLWMPAAVEFVHLNGQPVSVSYDPALSTIRLLVPVGLSEIWLDPSEPEIETCGIGS